MRHVAVMGIIGAAIAASAFVGCGKSNGFVTGDDKQFDFDASTAPDGPVCGKQCSLDARSIIDGCTGETVEACSDDKACGAGVCQEPCAAAAADRSSNGCEFYLQEPLYTKVYGQSCYAAFVVNTSNQPVDVTLERDGAELDISKAVFSTQPGSADLTPHEGSIAPGESVILFVSDKGPNGPVATVPAVGEPVPCPNGVVAASYAFPGPEGTGFGSSFRLKSTLPVALSSIYPYGGASTYLPGATLHLPVASWATENIIVNGWEGFHHPDIHAWAGAQIVASDDTDITIVPTTNLADGVNFVGAAAHRPTTYHLEKGQYLQLSQQAEFTGSLLYSSKPVGTFAGHGLPFVPTSSCCGDIIQQQIPAFGGWGNEYVGAGYRPRLGNESELLPYRIVAARDGTRLDYDPEIPAGAPTELSAGEFATFAAPTGHPFVVRTQDADHPIYLAAYMSGADGGGIAGPSGFDGRGDPEMVNVIPTGQYLNSYSFFADPTYSETSLVIVRRKNHDKFEDVWLECAGTLTDFKPVGTRGEYEWRRVDLTRNHGPGDTFGDSTCTSGLQRMRSEGAFTATIWGWDLYASYAYPGGMAQRKLVPNALPPVN
ncbi:hypothetical protein AKJ09_06855 [Labilithrix luteola]|uniref:IgGFc-binding protein N-terminal domain-containing protein n=1 Tax=Labilithrix luteola TaxID=1391654 RepID=A0A0K1Q3I5_9BACT|nr:IgGFc-binding protein [Labilithrix luteola]AKV00192.1 hypothetical protein AKJ09_06855 [Labilithrix luteola]